MPFGFVQLCVCLGGCTIAAKWGRKGFVLIGILLPCVLGSGLLFGPSNLVSGFETS